MEWHRGRVVGVPAAERAAAGYVCCSVCEAGEEHDRLCECGFEDGGVWEVC